MHIICLFGKDFGSLIDLKKNSNKPEKIITVQYRQREVQIVDQDKLESLSDE